MPGASHPDGIFPDGRTPEVSDLQAAAGWAATEGYGLVGGIGEYEGAWRMAYVRGPEGIIVSLAEPIG